VTFPSGTGVVPDEIPIDYTASWERDFGTAAKALTEIVGALTQRSSEPPEGIFHLGAAGAPAAWGHIRVRARRIVLTNTDAATQTFTLAVGMRTFLFRVPTTTTLDLPFPYVVDRGVDVALTTTGGAGTASAYLTGFEE
jgi:hypothetical protein